MCVNDLPPRARPARQEGIARARLRAATAPDHEAVDALYTQFDISGLAGYRAFLEAQYATLAPLEDRITAVNSRNVPPDWAQRRRTPLLIADLKQMGGLGTPPGPLAVAFPSPAAILGAIYVLEGSRFGGAMLARRLPAGAPARFLGAGIEPQSWRGLIAALDDHLGDDMAMADAIAAARAVFAAFATAARTRQGAANG